MTLNPQRKPYPDEWVANVMRVIDAIVDGDQVTDKDYVDALIAALPDPLQYKGVWDASTNTPTLSNIDTDVTGYVYRCNVAGSVDFGAGSITFTIGDFAVNNGTIWEKWDAGDIVSSVFTRQGAIVAATSDYDASQIDNDSGVAGTFVSDALDALAALIPVYGTEYDSQENSTPASTSGSGYVDQNVLSLSSLPVGTYRIGWTGLKANSSTSGNVRIRCQAVEDPGGTPSTTILGSEASVQAHQSGGITQRLRETGSDEFTNGSAQDVDIEIAVSNTGPGTATLFWSRLEIWRVA